MVEIFAEQLNQAHIKQHTAEQSTTTFQEPNSAASKLQTALA